MTDRLTPAQRHRCMSQIRSKNTKPELLVRRWLWQHGYRYRLNVRGVPGKPDIVMRRYRTAIFVNGCFWHGHEGCKKFKMPKSNVEFWRTKINRNQERDQQNYQILQENGWQVIVIWECWLTVQKIENTMRRVELQLQQYFLETYNSKSKPYTLPREEEFSIAAENWPEYDSFPEDSDENQ